MGLAQPQLTDTAEAYLAGERQSEERHEYLDGKTYAMAGESLEHSTITANLIIRLGLQLLGKPCRTLSPNMKVRSGPSLEEQHTSKGMFSYPDVTVVCGEPRFHDPHRDVLLNPTLIIEVLSPTTEAFDRGEKFLRYRTSLETLTDYVLVSQAHPLIEHFERRPGGQWLYSSLDGLEGSLTFASIACSLRLAEVYDRITFPPEGSLLPPGESGATGEPDPGHPD
ncbi:MAG: Uma2 family endonuclease [Gammaproteobacteria bacterium]